MTYDAVILDMDGVLVEALAAYGVTDPKPADLGFLEGFPVDLSAATAHFETEYDLACGDLWNRRSRTSRAANRPRAISTAHWKACRPTARCTSVIGAQTC